MSDASVIDAMFNGKAKDVDFQPVMNDDFSYGDFQLVGHGEVTNEACGVFCGHYYGCLRTDLHNLVTLDGVNYAGKVFAKPVFHWCHKPSCPKCYRYGWAVREAQKIEARLVEASKHFGLVEHISVTFPSKYWHLTFEVLRKKAVEILKRRSVIGGCLIFHGFRFNTRQYWYWSPHFHCLGFILGGFGKCRGCRDAHTLACKGCGGWLDRHYRAFDKDGCIVKVEGKRKKSFYGDKPNIAGTAWYLLHHASIKKNVKRFHAVIWFGVVSYRKLKITVERRKSLCPICGSELVKIGYGGLKRFATNRYSPSFRRVLFEDMDEGSGDVWYKIVAKYGSGNYEE